MPAFTEKEFEEAVIERQKIDNKAHTLKISTKMLEVRHDEEGLKTAKGDLAQTNSQAMLRPEIKQPLNKSKSTENSEDDEQTGQESEANLFGGLLGSNGQNVLEIKQRKLARKKEIIHKMQRDEKEIQAFSAYESVVKENPLLVIKQLACLKQQ